MTIKGTKWGVEPHTVAKHRILVGYLQQWFAKLAGAQYSNLTYIDGFSGPGRYSHGEDGSPLVALKALIEHDSFPKWRSTRFDFIFIEQDKARFESLEQEIEELRDVGQLPSNIRIRMLNDEFQEAAGSLSQSGELSSKPFFAFVDPFGFKGIPMSLLAKLIRPNKGELFLNLSTDAINRFFKESSVAKPLDALFGMDAEERISKLKEDDRAERIASLFQEQLKIQAKVQYAWKFGMEFPNGHIGYHLVYATHHKAGLEAMKNAMWKVDPTGGYQFADRVANQLVLFEKDPNTNPLRLALMQEFSGRIVSIDDIEEFTLTDTSYLTGHIRTKTLVPMEQSGQIAVTKRTGRTGFKAGTLIRFS